MAIQIPTVTSVFHQLVEQSIEQERIHPNLHTFCRRTGNDYNEVVEHIGAEVKANRATF